MPLRPLVAQYPEVRCGEASSVVAGTVRLSSASSIWLVWFGQGILRSRPESDGGTAVGDAFGTESAEQAQISVSPCHTEM